MNRYDLITAPETEPVTIDQVVMQSRDIDNPEQYDLWEIYIESARMYVENIIGPVIAQTWDMTIDAFPNGNTIEIEKQRVTSVTSLKYTDEDGTETTFDSDKYIVDASGSGYAKITLKDDYSWPTVTLKESGAVVIRFIAGYDSASTVPAQIKHAIMLLVAHYDANRLPANLRNMEIQNVPYSVTSLLAQLGDYHV